MPSIPSKFCQTKLIRFAEPRVLTIQYEDDPSIFMTPEDVSYEDKCKDDVNRNADKKVTYTPKLKLFFRIICLRKNQKWFFPKSNEGKSRRKKSTWKAIQRKIPTKTFLTCPTTSIMPQKILIVRLAPDPLFNIPFRHKTFIPHSFQRTWMFM